MDVRIDEHAVQDDEEAPAMHADADDHLPLIRPNTTRGKETYVWLSNVYTV